MPTPTARLDEQYAPHSRAYSLQELCTELANLFHTYYNADKFWVDDLELSHARLCLVRAAQNHHLLRETKQ